MSEAGGSADASSSCKWCTSYRRFFHELPSADIRASECSAPRTDRALPNQITKELLLGYFPEQFNSRAALNDLVFDDIQARLRIQVLKPVCDACSANSVLKRLCELLDPRAGCDGDGQTPCKQTGRCKEMLFDDALELVSAGPCGAGVGAAESDPRTPPSTAPKPSSGCGRFLAGRPSLLVGALGPMQST